MLKIKPLLCLLLAAALMLMCGVATHDLFKGLSIKQPIIFEFNKNTSSRKIADFLLAKQLIMSRYSIAFYLRLSGFGKAMQAGIYQINPGESVANLINKIRQGQVLTQQLTIIEGMTLKNLKLLLKEAPYLNAEGLDLAQFKQEHLNSEGLFLADTYQYDAGSDAQQLLATANLALYKVLTLEWQNKAPNVPYKTAYELLIAASIIEKEASLEQERKLISGVIVNRLNKNMRLQMDPTVIYAINQEYIGKLSRKDLQRKSPYNTYRVKGLPPTPIALVGADAINAAAHPQASEYLYYVARGDGSHQFSKSYAEQMRAVNKYQRNNN